MFKVKNLKKNFSNYIGQANPFRLTLTFFIPFLIILVILFSLIIRWESKRIREEQISNLKHIARAFLEQIQVTRLWNTQLGGVYAEVTNDVQPNQFLDDPHRDILSTDGKRYTKINPAYMTRQLSEIANSRQGYKFRVVSLNPINPYNVPDEWERKSLEDFSSKGLKEASIFINDRNASFFKYIAPIQIEHPCLRCHNSPASDVGTKIMGGITVIIPTEGFDHILSLKTKRTIISLLLVGIISIFFVGIVTFYVSRLLSKGIASNLEQEKLQTLIELAGATAHEMRQPMTVIQSLVTLSHIKLNKNEPINKEIDIIKEQSERMNDIIKKMLNITDYKTKDYVQGKKIVDFEKSAKTNG